MKKNTFRFTKNRNDHSIEQESSFNAPAALRAQLAASFTQWQGKPLSMTRGADGLWHTKVKLATGTCQYRCIVAGEWHDDPTCTLQFLMNWTAYSLQEAKRAA